MDTRAADTVRDYYDALRNGDPLPPYFLEDESTVKFGISEALFGADEVAEALRTQTETTAAWTIDGGCLVVDEREAFATFADEVTMAWTDVETGDRRRFDTRWSGTLVPASEDGTRGRGTAGTGRNGTDRDDRDGPDWLFTTMHVSTADDL